MHDYGNRSMKHFLKHPLSFFRVKLSEFYHVSNYFNFVHIGCSQFKKIKDRLTTNTMAFEERHILIILCMDDLV